MQKLISDKQQLNQFNIGIEFEFYVAKKTLKEIVLATNNIDYETAGKYFIEKLYNKYPEENWNELFRVTYDYSLNNNNVRIGVEMVLKHDLGLLTLQRLKKVFHILESSEFIINKDCALHINISFLNKSKNKKDLIFDVLPFINIEEILLQFQREKNELCQTNFKTKIYKEDIKEDEFKELSQFLINKYKTKKYSLDKVLSVEMLLKTEKKLKNKIIKIWKESRPAIAPRVYNKEYYLEFRLIGGANHQYRLEEIEKTIEKYLYAMDKASNR